MMLLLGLFGLVFWGGLLVGPVLVFVHALLPDRILQRILLAGQGTA